jgi:hypothetical protein
LFALHADFWLKSEGEAADPTFADGARAGAKKGAAAAPPASAGGGAPGASARATAAKGLLGTTGPVTLHPRSMELGLGEARELLVLTYPQVEGPVADAVMCR